MSFEEDKLTQELKKQIEELKELLKRQEDKCSNFDSKTL